MKSYTSAMTEQRRAARREIDRRVKAHAAKNTTEITATAYEVRMPPSLKPFLVSNEWHTLRKAFNDNMGRMSMEQKVKAWRKISSDFRFAYSAQFSRDPLVGSIGGPGEPFSSAVSAAHAGAYQRELEARSSVLKGKLNAASREQEIDTSVFYEMYLETLCRAAADVRQKIWKSGSTWLKPYESLVKSIPKDKTPEEAWLVNTLLGDLVYCQVAKTERERIDIVLGLGKSVLTASGLCITSSLEDLRALLVKQSILMKTRCTELDEVEEVCKPQAIWIMSALKLSELCKNRLQEASLPLLERIVGNLNGSYSKSDLVGILEPNLSLREELSEPANRKARANVLSGTVREPVHRYPTDEELKQLRKQERQRDLAFARRYIALKSTAETDKKQGKAPVSGRVNSTTSGQTVAAQPSTSYDYSAWSRKRSDTEPKEPTLRELALRQRNRGRRFRNRRRCSEERAASLGVGRGKNLVFRNLQGDLSIYPLDPSLVDSVHSDPSLLQAESEISRIPLDTILKEQQAEMEQRHAEFRAMRALELARQKAASRSRTGGRHSGSGGSKKSSRKRGKGKSAHGKAVARDASSATETQNSPDPPFDAIFLDDDGQILSTRTYVLRLGSFEDDHSALSYNSLENDKVISSWTQEDSGPSRPRRQSICLPVESVDYERAAMAEE